METRSERNSHRGVEGGGDRAGVRERRLCPLMADEVLIRSPG